MRRVFALTIMALAAAALWGCGKDRPTSYQDFIFGKWEAMDAANTFVEVTFTKGATTAVGTYSARYMTQTEGVLGDESGSIAISGSVIFITSPRFTQPLRFTWNVVDNVLTLQGDFLTETYRKG